MTLLDELLSNPVLLAAIISAVVSFIVSWFFGERAATRLAIKEERRARHHSSLVHGPLDLLVRGLNICEDAVKIEVASSTDIRVAQIYDYVKGATKNEDELDLLLSHLKTGYPEIFLKVDAFQSEYMSIRERTLDIGRRTLATINVQNAPPPNSINASMSEFSNFAFAIQLFSYHSLGGWKTGAMTRDIATVEQGGVDGRVMYHVQRDGGTVVKTSINQVAVDTLRKMNELKDSSFNRELLKLYNETLSLRQEYEDLARKLYKIRVYIDAGVPLKGHCEAGRGANPRLE